MITREEAIKQLESLYDHCENMRSGDNDFAVWERDCEAIKIALAALRPVSREQVEKVFGAKWDEETYTTVSGLGRLIHSKKYTCSACGKSNGRAKTNFCPACGRAMTDEAVEMVMERLEELHDTSN